MADDYFKDLPHTFLFLNNAGCQTGNLFQDQYLLRNALVKNLQLDGYRLQPIEAITHRHLRDGNVPDSNFSLNLIMIIFCVICAGLASGLTQGLLSLDFLEMKIKSQSGTPKEKEHATRVLPIIKHHHLLLVTLMLWNASATEALPIFLNSFVSEAVAIVISVTLVLMFGEIIPASILTGPRQLEIVSFLTPLVYLVYFIFFPVAYPISKVLDFIIGHEEGLTLYSRREIITMMRMQHEEATRRHGGAGMRDSVDNDEMMIIDGALTFRDMKVSEVMTPIDKAFMISANENLSYKTLYEIFKAGFSRIPVYEKDRNDIIGLLFAKDLIFVDPEDETPISNFVEFFSRRPMTVWHDQLLGEVLAAFRRERAHLAIVRDVVSGGEGDPYYKVVGIITLEDIIEEILGAEIEDEFDVHDDEESAVTTGRDPAQQRLDRHLRDMDLARLKSLRSKITDDTLSADEIQAIVHFLPKNVPQVKEYIEKYKLSLTEVIQKSHVFLLKKQTKEGALKPHPNDIIVKKGKFTNTCILILQGRVKIIQETESKEEINDHNTSNTNASTPVATPSRSNSIAEGSNILSVTFKTTATELIIGPWSTLCADALISSDGTYTPTFSAYIHSNDLRFVRLATIFSVEFNNYSHSLLERRRGGLPSKGASRSNNMVIRSSKTPNKRMSIEENHFSRTRSYHGTGGMEQKQDQNSRTNGSNFFFRRSLTTEPGGFRDDSDLSGVDEVSATRKSSAEQPMILLASLRKLRQYKGSEDQSDSERSEDLERKYRSYRPFSNTPTPIITPTIPSQGRSILEQQTSSTTNSPQQQQSRMRNTSPNPTLNAKTKRQHRSSGINLSHALRAPLLDPVESKQQEKAEEPVINKIHEERK